MTKPKKKPALPPLPADRGGGPDAATTEKVAKMIRLGAYTETAVAHAGLAKTAHYEWLKRGAKETARRAALADELAEEAEKDLLRVRSIRTEERLRRSLREQRDRELTTREQRYVDYMNAIEKALADAEMADVAVLAKAAQGGAVLGRTTRTKADGSVITTERLSEPQWTAAAWRLERKHPDRWGRRAVDVNVSGAVAVPEVKGQAREKLVAMLARVAAAKAEKQ
jgi:transposase